MLHRKVVTILLPILRRPRRPVMKLAPGGGGLADGLVTERQVEQRSELWTEPQALGEVRARLGVLPGVELLLARSKQVLCTHLVRDALGGSIRATEGEDA